MPPAAPRALRWRVGTAAVTAPILHAFACFAHTTLFALVVSVPDHAVLWRGLGSTYTVHGALMAAGRLLFAGAAIRNVGLAGMGGSILAHGEVYPR